MTSTRAAVVEAAGHSPILEDIDLAELKHDEVLVRIEATGICHTDVAYAAGDLIDQFPVVLGHESAGVVEAIGPGVTQVSRGDRVSLALSDHCGQCFFCETGRPMLCGRRANDLPRLSRHGKPVFGTAGFSTLTVVREATTVPIPEDVPFDVAAIVGCAVSTGLGAVFNLAKVRYGSRVAIIGAGGVGLSILMGATIAGAERIVVADPSPSRRQHALDLGATDAIESTEEALREAAPEGYEYVFESAGRTDAMEIAVRVTQRGGTVNLIGAPRPDATLTLGALDFVVSQRRIIGCRTGNVRPHVDFDRYFRLYPRGRLPLDRLVTGSLPLDRLSDGFERATRGEGIRTIVHPGA